MDLHSKKRTKVSEQTQLTTLDDDPPLSNGRMRITGNATEIGRQTWRMSQGYMNEFGHPLETGWNLGKKELVNQSTDETDHRARIHNATIELTGNPLSTIRGMIISSINAKNQRQTVKNLRRI